MRQVRVSVGDHCVGHLESLEDEEYIFRFDAEWLSNPDRPVLGQLFEDRRPRSIQTSGLPCWFAHLLPQGPLRRCLERGLKIEPDEDFALLAAVGDDLPGAVRVEEFVSAEPRSTPAISMERLPESPKEALRFSLAGAQWKLSVREGERGLTIPVRGEDGSMIAKFHDPNYLGLPRVELATVTWAERSGVPVAPTRKATVAEFAELPEVLPTGDGVLFLTRRFDRDGDRRIHMEDFGQILDRPPGDRQFQGHYEEICAVLGQIVAPEARQEQVRLFLEALVFHVLAGNTDAHLENWAVLYPDGRTPVLSPSYDLVSKVVYASPLADELALSLHGSKRFEDITARAMASVVPRGFSEGLVLGWVEGAVQRVLGTWRTASAHLGWTSEERDRIEAHLARVPLARGE